MNVSSTQIQRDLQESIAADQLRSEILVGWVQMAIVAVFTALYLASPKTFSADVPFEPVPWALGGYFAFTAIRLFLAHRIRLPGWYVVVSIAVDMALLLGLIWSFHLQYGQPPAFYLKAPTFVYLFIFISLRALRFDPWHMAAAGGIAAAGWLLMVIYALAYPMGAERTRDYVHYLTSNSILVGGEVDKIVAILVVSAVLVAVVARGRRLLASQIETTREVNRLVSELSASDERYALVLAGANDGIYDIDLARGTGYFSPRANEMLGFAPETLEIEDDGLLPRIHPEDHPRFMHVYGDAIGHAAPVLDCEVRLIREDGQPLWIKTRAAIVYGEDGRAIRIVGSLTDISERKRHEEQLLRDAFHDRLTGLPNRALLTDRLSQQIRLSDRRGAAPFTLLLLDLDNFKTINDSMGHPVGDEMLVSVARRLEAAIRPGDTVARLGGDEFAVLVEGIGDESGMALVLARLQAAIEEPLDLHASRIVATASVGVVLSADAADSPEEILRDADVAMYQAKQAGRRTHVVFHPDMRSAVSSRLALENQLRQAVERGEFELFYQPIIDLAKNRIAGFEALIRWRHPERGLVSPVDFIPVAEETGLIIEMGNWAIREASLRLVGWMAETGRRELFVTVNVSARQFEPDGGLLEAVGVALERTGLSPHALKLEVTESLMSRNPEAATAILCRLSRLGVRLAIDDFGTGYSSLSQLHRLPFNTLKIDRSFTCQIGKDPKGAGVLDAINDIAGRMGLDVVAEGVETEDERRHLARIGCKYGQGYLFARPLVAQDAARRLSEEAA